MKSAVYILLCKVILLFTAIPTYAVKAISTPVTFFRADGKRVSVRIYGDEFFSYKKDEDGFLVEQGPDGLLHYADYDTGELRLSENKRTAVPRLLMTNIREKNILQKRNSILGVKSGLPLCFNLGTPTLSKIIKTPVLLVEFADIRFSAFSPIADFKTQLNHPNYSINGATGSAADYFKDNFNGQYSFVFDVFPIIIRLEKNKSYYGADGAGGVDARISELFQDVCDAAVAAGLNFVEYDWAGDGQIRDVAFIYAGTSQSETGVSGDIWPQYHALNNTSYQGKTIAAFSCSAELSAVGLLKGQMAGIGTFCHEFAHSLGLPDMYDTNEETEGKSEGLWGVLSLMDEGNYLNNGHTPPYFTAIEREIVGHKTLIPVPKARYLLNPVWNGGEIYRIDSETPGEYFLIECRNPIRWDAYIGGGGMIVYHVDKSEQVYGGIASSLRWQYNNVNAFSEHPCARIFAPSFKVDGGTNLFFPGIFGNTHLSSYGKPRFTDWLDRPLKINISEISYDKKVVQFNVLCGQFYDALLPYPIEYKIFPYQYDCRIEWSFPEGSVVQGGKWRVRWKPIHERAGSSSEEEIFSFANYCYLSHINPANEYEVSVVFEKANYYGEEIRFRFSTLPITSLMPYIPLRGSYSVGEVIDLRALNLTEEYDQLVWRINGKEQLSTRFILSYAGIFTIRTEIKYKDGSLEFIVKKIKVN